MGNTVSRGYREHLMLVCLFVYLQLGQLQNDVYNVQVVLAVSQHYGQRTVSNETVGSRHICGIMLDYCKNRKVPISFTRKA